MAIIRVFPRRTKATPDDEYAFVGDPGLFVPPADEIHVSCAFTEDLPEAERLAKSWSRYGLPVKIGGPAIGEAGGDFVPGKYLKHGYVITSRGCPNRCWFCSVWKREGKKIRELPITEGWNLQDDNILACSDGHIKAVFEMLQKSAKKYRQRIEFTGGLEAARLKPWHITELAKMSVSQLFFAYDTPNDRDPLFEAGKLLSAHGFNFANRKARAYVLIGYPKDTPEAAENRLNETVDAGFMPHAMLYRDGKNEPTSEWKKLQRLWARPAIISKIVKEKRNGR